MGVLMRQPVTSKFRFGTHNHLAYFSQRVGTIKITSQ